MVVPKFRAWVEAEETMHPVLSLDWSGIDDNLTVFVPMGHTSSRAVSIDNAVLMQSTGLFDKNGKEIFEGDVVKIMDEDGDSEISAVAFKDGAFGMTLQEVFVPFAAMSILSTVDYTLEIHGSIYENPELVEELE
ncbi:TPA: YopX family protein [Streptococcus suis]